MKDARDRVPRRATASLVAVLVVLFAGCNVPGQDRAVKVDPAYLPSSEPRARSDGTAAGATQVYFRRGARLVPVVRGATVDPRTALAELVVGLRPDEVRAGLASEVPPELIVAVRRVRDGAIVRLDDDVVQRDPPTTVAVAQIVLTLTGLPGIDAVRFVTLEGPYAVATAAGGRSSGRLGTADFASLTVPAARVGDRSAAVAPSGGASTRPPARAADP